MINNILNSKPMFYKEIDYDRMPKAFNYIKDNINLKNIIHIVGTNGKGSTGRFLAYTLYKKGYNVGHYTSPHILKFNERFWINNRYVTDKELELAHKNLAKFLPKELLDNISYFEYATLLSAILFENLDYAIIEAGLGGEFDATNVFKKKISLITTIDYDHQDFLGNSIEEIALTKLKSIDKEAIIGKQIHKEVEKISDLLTQEGKKIYSYLDFFDKEEINFLRKNFKFAEFLFDNYLLAMSFLKKEKIEFSINNIRDLELKGRFEKLEDDLYIDVGHNVLAAKAIANSLNKKINLVYNTYKDKNYKEILRILKPKINKLYLIEVENERIEDKNKIKEVAQALNIKVENFKKIEKPMLVFGSFSVVEKFLKEYYAKQSI